MYHIITLFFVLSAVTCFSQRPAADQFETTKGPLQVQPVFHGALVLTWNGKTIYVDPYGGANAYKGLAAPDLVLITDIHQDHLDLKTLQAINTENAKFIVPQAVAEKLPAEIRSQAIVLANNRT